MELDSSQTSQIFSLHQNDSVIMERVSPFLGQPGSDAQVLQGAQQVYGERLHRWPFLLRETAITRVCAFFTQPAGFPHQPKSLVVAFQEKGSLQAHRAFPASYLLGTFTTIVQIEIRTILSSHKQKGLPEFPQYGPCSFRTRCGRWTTPVGVVLFTSIAAFQMYPLAYQDLFSRKWNQQLQTVSSGVLGQTSQ